MYQISSFLIYYTNWSHSHLVEAIYVETMNASVMQHYRTSLDVDVLNSTRFQHLTHADGFNVINAT